MAGKSSKAVEACPAVREALAKAQKCQEPTPGAALKGIECYVHEATT